MNVRSKPGGRPVKSFCYRAPGPTILPDPRLIDTVEPDLSNRNTPVVLEGKYPENGNRKLITAGTI
jgi:hypothetical protein